MPPGISLITTRISAIKKTSAIANFEIVSRTLVVTRIDELACSRSELIKRDGDLLKKVHIPVKASSKNIEHILAGNAIIMNKVINTRSINEDVSRRQKHKCE